MRHTFHMNCVTAWFLFNSYWFWTRIHVTKLHCLNPQKFNFHVCKLVQTCFFMLINNKWVLGCGAIVLKPSSCRYDCTIFLHMFNWLPIFVIGCQWFVTTNNIRQLPHSTSTQLLRRTTLFHLLYTSTDLPKYQIVQTNEKLFKWMKNCQNGMKNCQNSWIYALQLSTHSIWSDFFFPVTWKCW
jgi:hypothetical protein